MIVDMLTDISVIKRYCPIDKFDRESLTNELHQVVLPKGWSVEYFPKPSFLDKAAGIYVWHPAILSGLDLQDSIKMYERSDKEASDYVRSIARPLVKRILMGVDELSAVIDVKSLPGFALDDDMDVFHISECDYLDLPKELVKDGSIKIALCTREERPLKRSLVPSYDDEGNLSEVQENPVERKVQLCVTLTTRGWGERGHEQLAAEIGPTVSSLVTALLIAGHFSANKEGLHRRSLKNGLANQPKQLGVLNPDYLPLVYGRVEGQFGWKVLIYAIHAQYAELSSQNSQKISEVTRVFINKKFHQRMKTATRLLSRAMQSTDQAASVIMSAACVESLVSSKGDAISERVASRSAALVCSNGDDRIEFKKFVKKLYGKRSDFVHGNPGKTEISEDIARDWLQLACVIYRCTIQWIDFQLKIDDQIRWEDFVEQVDEAAISGTSVVAVHAD